MGLAIGQYYDTFLPPVNRETAATILVGADIVSPSIRREAVGGLSKEGLLSATAGRWSHPDDDLLEGLAAHIKGNRTPLPVTPAVTMSRAAAVDAGVA